MSIRLILLLAFLTAAPAQAAAAAPALLPPQTVADTYYTPRGAPALAGDGEALVLPDPGNPGPIRVHGRRPGGSWGPVAELGTGRFGLLAVTDGGERIVTFGASGEVRASIGLTTVQTVATQVLAGPASLAVAPGGAAAIAFAGAETPGGPVRPRLVIRKPGGTFGPPVTLADGAPSHGLDIAVVVAPDGAALAAWRDGTEVLYARVDAAGVPGPVGRMGDATDAEVRLALAPDGRAWVAWYEGGVGRLRAATAPPGGPFGASQVVAEPIYGDRFGLADDGRGGAALAWAIYENDQSGIATARTDSAGSFGARTVLTSAYDVVDEVALARGPGGHLVAGWAYVTPTGEPRVAAAHAAPGGDLSLLTDAVVPAGRPSELGVAVDEQGNALLRWTAGDEPKVQVAGLDAAPPRVRIDAPAAVTTGVPARVAATAVDVWSPVTEVSVAFGDGSSAAGSEHQHVWATPGPFGITAVATDSLGQRAAATQPLTASPPDTPVVRPTPPVLSQVRLERPRLRRHAGRVRPTLRLTASEPATALVTVQRCAPRCRRVGRVLKRPLAAGPNRIALRLALRRGTYRISITAHDADGLRSRTHTRRLRVTGA